jgi:hypothetical protein
MLLSLKKLKELNAIKVYQSFHEEVLLLTDLQVKFQAGNLSHKELKHEFKRESEDIYKGYPLKISVE